MNEFEIAKNALKQIVGYYRRSHKHGENTCYMMFIEAERALQEMSLLTQRAADGANMSAREALDKLSESLGQSGVSPEEILKGLEETRQKVFDEYYGSATSPAANASRWAAK